LTAHSSAAGTPCWGLDGRHGFADDRQTIEPRVAHLHCA